MSYRTITVAGRDYEYTIGDTFTKVKDVGLFRNSEIGSKVFGPYNKNKVQRYVVGPANVASAISGRPMRPQKCRHGTVTTDLYYDPFDAEIYEKCNFIIACDDCFHEAADEI